MVTQWEATRTPGIFRTTFERRGSVEVRYRARYRDASGKSRIAELHKTP